MPRATRLYISPVNAPLIRSSRKYAITLLPAGYVAKGQYPFQNPDVTGFIYDARLEFDLFLIGIQGVDNRPVVFFDHVATQLACTGDFTVVRIEFLVKVHKTRS